MSSMGSNSQHEEVNADAENSITYESCMPSIASRFYCEGTMTDRKNLSSHVMKIQSHLINHIIVPFNRFMYCHKQALTMILFRLMICLFLLVSLCLVLLLNWWLIFVLIIYLTRIIFIQTYAQRDRLRQKWLRRAFWWKLVSGRLICCYSDNGKL